VNDVSCTRSYWPSARLAGPLGRAVGGERRAAGGGLARPYPLKVTQPAPHDVARSVRLDW